MSNIPFGWGPIVQATDRAIKTLHPGYVIYEIAEKFGGLSYRCSVGEDPAVEQIIREAEVKIDTLKRAQMIVEMLPEPRPDHAVEVVVALLECGWGLDNPPDQGED